MKTTLIKLFIATAIVANFSQIWAQSTPTLVHSFIPGTSGGSPRSMVTGGGYLFAIADSGGGTFVWRYDGTNATRISQFGVTPVELVYLNNIVYYTGTNASTETSLYKWDGATISEIRSIPTGNPASQSLRVYNNELYFSSATVSSGVELHKYNGTTLTFFEGNPSGGSFPSNIRVVNNKIYFYGTTNSFNNEPFECNGTTAVPLANVNPAGNSFANEFTEFQGQVYFAASNGTNGVELMRYNGSTVTLAADINPTGNSSPTGLRVFNNNLYFAATNGVNGVELWKFDGTNATMVSDLRVGSSGSSPQRLTVCNNKLYFVADNGVAGSEVWEYDGTNLALYDIVPGSGSSSPTSLFNFNNNLFFSATGGSIQTELFRIYNSTLSSYDINPFGNSVPDNFINWNNKLYFGAFSFGNGRELFRLCPHTSRTLSSTTCFSYTSPSGNYTYTTSGTYFDTIPNYTGCDSIIQLNLTIDQIPSTPGTISGNTTPCESVSENYSIAPVSGADSYTWSLPGGWTGSSVSQNISVTTGTTGGTISVTASNVCGTSSPSNLNINLINIPLSPDTIYGPTSLCNGVNQIFSIDSVAGATSYAWVIPSGWSGSSSTSSINVTGGSVGGNIEVQASNICGTSASYLFYVNSIDIPNTPGSITGNTNVCSGLNENYSIANVTDATSYNWTLPAGWVGSSNTNSIIATTGTTGGTITVNASNVCGTSADTSLFVSVTITPTITVSDTTICYNSFALISASSDLGSIEWYNSSVGGSAFNTGNSYTTGNLTTDMTYYLQAENNGCINNPRIPINVMVLPIINTSINTTGSSLIADESNASLYQWLDCNNGLQSISGATNQTLLPPDDGEYAVILQVNGCTDTSDCVAFFFAGVDENQTRPNVQIYPNPVVDYVTIEAPEEADWMKIVIYSVSGQVIYSNESINSNSYKFLYRFSTGVYQIVVETNLGFSSQKMVVVNQ